jgi:hypothetical protein
VKIYQLLLDDRHTVFYADPAGLAAPAGGGLIDAGWIERKWRDWNEKIEASEGGAGAWIRRALKFLERFVAADEAMLRALRHARAIEIEHPANVQPRAVRRAWRFYLAREQGRHLFWFITCMLILPVSVLLSLLPGPNVFGFWFAFRVGGHGLALRGIHRARKREMNPTFSASADLDVPLRGPHGWNEPTLEHLATHCGLTGLRAYLERHRQEGEKAGAVPADAPAAPDDDSVAGLPVPDMNPDPDTDHPPPDAPAQLQHPQGDRRP